VQAISLRSALASTWRMRLRITENSWRNLKPESALRSFLAKQDRRRNAVANAPQQAAPQTKARRGNKIAPSS